MTDQLGFPGSPFPDRAQEESDVASFADFLRRIGHRVVRTASGQWYDAHRFFFLGFPSHRPLDPTADELRAVMAQRPCLGLRFPAPLGGPGRLSYQIVCDSRDYGEAILSANTRSKVRRGLRRCDVEAVSFPAIAEGGGAADRDTLERQGRRARWSGERWRRYWDAAAVAPGMEGWGAFASGELVAYLVTVRFGDSVEFLVARSRSDRSDLYPNNALIFRVAEEMLVRRGLRRITFGLESLEPVAALDEFKLGMGFRREPIRQRVVFRPALQAVLGRPLLRSAVRRSVERLGGGFGFGRKAAGLLRFAEESGI